MSETPAPVPLTDVSGPASAIGIATRTAGEIIEVWYPQPALGDTPLDVADLATGITTDHVRGVTTDTVTTTIADLQAPADSVADVYLRLHSLSHRLVRPRTINLDGIF